MNGTHKHRCPSDGMVWEHPDHCAGNTPAHTCPLCGREVWQRYDGRLGAIEQQVCTSYTSLVRRMTRA